MAKNPNAGRIASLIQTKRNQQDMLRNVRKQKADRSKALTASIKSAITITAKNSFRNQKTSSNNSFQIRIQSIQKQIINTMKSIQALRK